MWDKILPPRPFARKWENCPGFFGSFAAYSHVLRDVQCPRRSLQIKYFYDRPNWTGGPNTAMGTSLGQIHPTAIVSPLADLAEDVQIGPYCIIDGDVQIGAGCVLAPYVHVIGPAKIGSNNRISTAAVLGDAPQSSHYHGEVTGPRSISEFASRRRR